MRSLFLFLFPYPLDLESILVISWEGCNSRSGLNRWERDLLRKSRSISPHTRTHTHARTHRVSWKSKNGLAWIVRCLADQLLAFHTLYSCLNSLSICSVASVYFFLSIAPRLLFHFIMHNGYGLEKSKSYSLQTLFFGLPPLTIESFSMVIVQREIS